MQDRDLLQRNAELAQLMRVQLGIRRGDSLGEKLRVAGRLVPKAERRAGRTLVEAERLWANPKLRRQLDPGTLMAAETRLRQWLATIDAADRRKGILLGVLASLAFNFLLIAAAVIGLLVWTGRV
ncbi:MAG: hypothetical protein AAGG09_21780 [Pseudomonadota bacterium]